MKRDDEKAAVDAICQKLIQLRQERGISQQRLSEMAGISRTGLRHIEGMNGNPTLYSLLKLAKALQVDLRELWR